MITIGVLAFLPTVRHCELLERALASLANQESSPQFEVVLVDNGNQENSDWIRKCAEKYGAKYIKRTDSEIAAARDMVLRLESKYVGFVDSDVEVPPNWVARMVTELDRNFDLSAVASPNGPPQGESAFDQALRALFQVPWNFLGSPQALQASGGPREVEHLSSCAVVYRRESVLQVGGYDLGFSVVCEDLELSQRLRKSGRLLMIGDSPVIHRQDQDLFSWCKRMFRYGWGQIEVMRKHPSQVFSLKAALIPMFFLFLISLYLTFQKEARPLMILLSLYGALAIGGIIWHNRFQPFGVLLRSAILTIFTHMAYVLGMLAGVAGIMRNPQSRTAMAVTRTGDS